MSYLLYQNDMKSKMLVYLSYIQPSLSMMLVWYNLTLPRYLLSFSNIYSYILLRGESCCVFSLDSNPFRSIGDESTNHEATLLLLM